MTHKEFFIRTWNHEMEITVRALKALPEGEVLQYRYQPKSRTVKELVDHFVSHAEDLAEAAGDGVLNHRITASYDSVAAAIEALKTESARFISLLQKTSDADWNNKDITMYVFGQDFGTLKLGDRCWQFLLDVIHHRGQLSTTYRHLGVTQPSVYGPTAEMVEAMMAAGDSLP